MQETESAVNDAILKLKYEVKKAYYAKGDMDIPTIEIVPIQINWKDEEGKYKGWKEAENFDVKSLDDYDIFFETEEKYFYEQDIYT